MQLGLVKAKIYVAHERSPDSGYLWLFIRDQLVDGVDELSRTPYHQEPPRV